MGSVDVLGKAGCTWWKNRTEWAVVEVRVRSCVALHIAPRCGKASLCFSCFRGGQQTPPSLWGVEASQQRGDVWSKGLKLLLKPEPLAREEGLAGELGSFLAGTASLQSCCLCSVPESVQMTSAGTRSSLLVLAVISHCQGEGEKSWSRALTAFQQLLSSPSQPALSYSTSACSS